MEEQEEEEEEEVEETPYITYGHHGDSYEVTGSYGDRSPCFLHQRVILRALRAFGRTRVRDSGPAAHSASAVIMFVCICEHWQAVTSFPARQRSWNCVGLPRSGTRDQFPLYIVL